MDGLYGHYESHPNLASPNHCQVSTYTYIYEVVVDSQTDGIQRPAELQPHYLNSFV